jgi:hypothetical protein
MPRAITARCVPWRLRAFATSTPRLPAPGSSRRSGSCWRKATRRSSRCRPSPRRRTFRCARSTATTPLARSSSRPPGGGSATSSSVIPIRRPWTRWRIGSRRAPPTSTSIPDWCGRWRCPSSGGGSAATAGGSGSRPSHERCGTSSPGLPEDELRRAEAVIAPPQHPCLHDAARGERPLRGGDRQGDRVAIRALVEDLRRNQGEQGRQEHA